jgi:hypothetical protein
MEENYQIRRIRMKLKVTLIRSLSAVLLIAYSRPSLAYIDPGTGTLLLQALLGGTAGALIVGRMYWARIKDFVSSMFSRSPAGNPEISSEDLPAEAERPPLD